MKKTTKKVKKQSIKDLYIDKIIDYDSVVSEVDYINELPGGFNQKSQKLDKPIKVPKVKTVAVVVEDKMLGSDAPLSHQVQRKCRDCGKELQSDRYYHCNKCVRNLPKDSGDEVYCG